MTEETAEQARRALLDAAERLLSGEEIGPLTGVRLVELAGVKRHRLTHDNPDIASSFKLRASEINRTKPEVDQLRTKLSNEIARSSRLAIEVASLRQRAEIYASRIDELTVERENIIAAMNSKSNVTAIRLDR